jgi:hypothetical protein
MLDRYKIYVADYEVKAMPMRYKEAYELGYIKTFIPNKDEDGYLVKFNEFDIVWMSKDDFEKRYKEKR